VVQPSLRDSSWMPVHAPDPRPTLTVRMPGALTLTWTAGIRTGGVTTGGVTTGGVVTGGVTTGGVTTGTVTGGVVTGLVTGTVVTGVESIGATVVGEVVVGVDAIRLGAIVVVGADGLAGVTGVGVNAVVGGVIDGWMLAATGPVGGRRSVVLPSPTTANPMIPREKHTTMHAASGPGSHWLIAPAPDRRSPGLLNEAPRLDTALDSAWHSPKSSPQLYPDRLGPARSPARPKPGPARSPAPPEAPPEAQPPRSPAPEPGPEARPRPKPGPARSPAPKPGPAARPRRPRPACPAAVCLPASDFVAAPVAWSP
jgi:hypothetical protein